MEKNNLKTGRIGEGLAAKYLKKKDYQIIDKNFRTRFGEIDLIVKKDNILVFVEVKARIGEWGNPEWQITKKKISKVKKMAQVYLIKKRPDYEDLRVDAVCLVLNIENQIAKVKHYKNVSF